MFRRKTGEVQNQRQERTHAARLQALGELLDGQNYDERGLCILPSGGGFIVTGFVPSDASSGPAMMQKTTEFTADDIAKMVSTITQVQQSR